jgi:hypothetical protein
MDRCLQVKQYVGEVRTDRGCFRVFRTGDDHFYLFDPFDPATGASGCIGFPVEKARLRDDLRRALAHGWGLTAT